MTRLGTRTVQSSPGPSRAARARGTFRRCFTRDRTAVAERNVQLPQSYLMMASRSHRTAELTSRGPRHNTDPASKQALQR